MNIKVPFRSPGSLKVLTLFLMATVTPAGASAQGCPCWDNMNPESALGILAQGMYQDLTKGSNEQITLNYECESTTQTSAVIIGRPSSGSRQFLAGTGVLMEAYNDYCNAYYVAQPSYGAVQPGRGVHSLRGINPGQLQSCILAIDSLCRQLPR